MPRIKPRRRRGCLAFLVLLVLLAALGAHPFLAWLLERLLLAQLSHVFAQPPRSTMVQIDLSEKRLRLDGVALDTAHEPALLTVARTDTLLRPASLWKRELTFPRTVQYDVELDLSRGPLSGLLKAEGERLARTEIGYLLIEGASLERNLPAVGQGRPGGRLLLPRVEMENLRLSFGETQRPDLTLAACLIARSTFALTDHAPHPPLAHHFRFDALDLSRVHYPARDSEALWPIKGGGEVGINGKTGSFYLSGGVNHTGQALNFTLRVDVFKLPLPEYSPYLSRPAQYGLLTCAVHAQCKDNQLSARLEGEVEQMWFQPRGDETRLFGLPEKLVLSRLIAQGNRLPISGARISGDVGDPRIAWRQALPVGLEYLLESQLRALLESVVRLGELPLSALAEGRGGPETLEELRREAEQTAR